jgi:hypothetical protein
MKHIFSLLAITALMVAMLLASALPAFAASDNASCVGQTASEQNQVRSGLGGEVIVGLAHFPEIFGGNQVDDFARQQGGCGRG